MNCPKCGSAQQDTARFCGVCGAPLAAPPSAAPAPAAPAYTPPPPSQPQYAPPPSQPQYAPPPQYAAPPYQPYQQPSAYPPAGYAPAPGTGAGMVWYVVAGVFAVLGILGSIGGAILSMEDDPGTAAVVYVFAAIFWMLAAVGFYFAKRSSAPRYPPAYGPPMPPR